MARGTPAFTSGTLTAVGSGQTKALGQTLRAQLIAYLSNSIAAWDLIQTVSDTPTNFNWIMHSPGDRALGAGGNVGDTDVFIKIYGTATTLLLDAYQDWSPTSGTGARIDTLTLIRMEAA